MLFLKSNDACWPLKRARGPRFLCHGDSASEQNYNEKARCGSLAGAVAVRVRSELPLAPLCPR